AACEGRPEADSRAGGRLPRRGNHPMTWSGPVILSDLPPGGPKEHRVVDSYDRAYRARPEVFLWYVAAVGPDPARNQRIADGLRWTGGGFVVDAKDEALNRNTIIASSFYPVVPGDRSRWRPAF
ncbi:hypothetical protein, partial [Frankia sp. AvcI1]